jgi:hypothetical protein
VEFWTEKTSGGWAGRLISGVAVIFLVFDGVTKLISVPQVVEATAQLGFPQSSLPAMGILLLACTLLYVAPRTTVLGAILLTGYLGGAGLSSSLRRADLGRDGPARRLVAHPDSAARLRHRTGPTSFVHVLSPDLERAEPAHRGERDDAAEVHAR